MWTREERYADPDAALLRAAGAWRERIEPERLRAIVESIPGPRSRLHAPQAMAAADARIADAWRMAGWRVGRQRLRLLSARRRPERVAPDLAGSTSASGMSGPVVGMNLVAISEGEGSAKDAIVVVAHHDTVRGSPGADDNAAGVAVLLELAARFAGRRFARTLVLAAPDFEEIGLVGSWPLVRWLRRRYRVCGAVVFDAIAYTDPQPGTTTVPPGIDRLYPGQFARVAAGGFRGDSIVTIYRRRSAALVREWARCLAATIGRDRVVMLRDPLDLPLVGPALALHPTARNFSRSDHVSFWRAGMPAIHVTDTGNFRNPHYHRPTDTPDTLDYETLARIASATALLIERLAQ